MRLNSKFRKILVEPRINIRQKLSDQFALKLEGEFKINRLLKCGFKMILLGVEKRRLGLVNETFIATSKQGSFGVEFNKKN
jgi:hypothetical protein